LLPLAAGTDRAQARCGVRWMHDFLRRLDRRRRGSAL